MSADVGNIENTHTPRPLVICVTMQPKRPKMPFEFALY
jgi:hypothetical protein